MAIISIQTVPPDKALQGCPFIEVHCPVSSAGCEAKQTQRVIKLHIQELIWHTQTQVRKILRLKTELEKIRAYYEELYFTIKNFKKHMAR